MSDTKKVSARASRNQEGTDEAYEEDAKKSARKSDVPNSAKSQHRETKIIDLVYKYLGNAKPGTSNSRGSLDEVSPRSSTSGADDRIRMSSGKKRSRKQEESSKFTNKYIRDALAFGIRSGCLIPVDSNCRVLRVSSALTNVKDCRSDVSANEGTVSRQKSEHSQSLAKGEIQEAGRRRRRSKRRRSRTRSRSSRRRKANRVRSRSHEDRDKTPETAPKSKKVPAAKRNQDPEDPDDYDVYSGDEDNETKKKSKSKSNDGKKGKTANSNHPDEDTNDNEVDEYASDNSVDEEASDDDEDKKD